MYLKEYCKGNNFSHSMCSREAQNISKMGLISAELFPTKTSFLVFISYMALFINQGILVTASKSNDNSYSYNTVTVVLLTECLKLVVALTIYLRDHKVSEFVSEFIKHKKIFLLYFVPAALYCLYNNLQFVNLASYDPTTYYLLLQFRVVITGIVFQILFKKQLSNLQWASICLLTIGCIIKEINHSARTNTTSVKEEGANNTDGEAVGLVSLFLEMDFHILLILLQVFSSCFAGVYNEYLLKNTGCEVHIMMSNVFMYVQSIICSIIVLAFQGELFSAFSSAGIASLAQALVLAILANSAAIGIVTSLFLRTLNSILKTFASALELMFTAVLCWLIFGIPIDMFTVLALVIVIAATFLYAQNPVVNKTRNELVDQGSRNV